MQKAEKPRTYYLIVLRAAKTVNAWLNEYKGSKYMAAMINIRTVKTTWVEC